MNLEGFGKLKKNFKGGGTLAALNSADVIRVNVGFLGQAFLAQPRSFPIPAHGFTNNFAFRFSHGWLRKQKREKVPTHAPCRMACFCLAFPAGLCHSLASPTLLKRVIRTGTIQLTEENL